MISGFSSGCPSDASEEMLLGFIPVYEIGNTSRCILPIRPAVGCGNQYWVFGADETVQKIQWIIEGSSQNISVVLDPTRTSHSVFAEPNGQWTDIGLSPIFDPTFVLTSTNGKSVNGYFNTSAEFIDTYGDGGQLSSWVLTGLSRYSTLRPDGLKRTEAECDVTLANSGSVRTVIISLNGIELCRGTRSGDGSITLAQTGTSGVSGSVTVAYTADVTSGAYVTKRYAASYAISCGGVSETIKDDGLAEILSFTLGQIAIGSQTLSIIPTSDTGIAGTEVTQSITIGGAPLPPGVPVYVSGDITDTVIHFAASATAGATYNIYMPQEVGGPTFIESPATTHAAGSGTISVTLPALTAAAGDVTVFVTSLNAGVESAYKKVTITYQADGTLESNAANVPSLKFQTIPVSSGRNINVTYTYNTVGQTAVPTKVQTQIQKYETGTITTQTAVNVGSVISNSISGNLTIASGSDGWFLVQVRSVTAASVNSAWSDWIGPVWCSNEVVSGITGLVANVVG